MYLSGWWEGFWVQEHFGRQSMREFKLQFSDGNITGQGKDIVGPFTFSGAYDDRSGHVMMVKQYLGKHAVCYTGHPDGEGCIHGTWEIPYLASQHSGTFMLKPVIQRPRGDEPIHSIDGEG